ncbi:hypothetical protein FGO68_gene15399 [Halteria grandinella]|uniref:Uncharacterized protein n=1 Tax=Halteria grandinella TaxID=5974 RepID=A0A8J8NV80_HALGN|nr:hypothetical protein FGO68_gene15399 [Halteria grandinella]
MFTLRALPLHSHIKILRESSQAPNSLKRIQRGASRQGKLLSSSYRRWRLFKSKNSPQTRNSRSQQILRSASPTLLHNYRDGKRSQNCTTLNMKSR